MHLIAKTFKGLEPLLAQELIALGAENVAQGRRVVTFDGDKRLMYRANFCLRTAIRVLKPIHTFRALSADDVYRAVQQLPWEQWLDPDKTFSVDSVVYSDEFANSRFVTYKVKDAIVDYFRERTGRRPSISISNPDIQLHIHISGDEATLALDSSGESLHKRGYRVDTVDAPLNEVLAAGLIMLTGWHGQCDLIDPMCGSGTILIEAALIAKGLAPGLFRKGYAFEKWADFDPDLFQEIYDDDSAERPFDHKIYGYDIDPKAVAIATANVRSANLQSDIFLKHQDVANFKQPADPSIIIVNPPYGERITTNDLYGTYRTLGERLKHAFKGNEAWVISCKDELFREIGLKASVKVPLYNGSLECEYRQYRLFDGKFRDFREEGGAIKDQSLAERLYPQGEVAIVTTKKPTKEQVRYSKGKNYRRRLEEKASNEAGDILSFKFHSLEKERSDKKRPYPKTHNEGEAKRSYPKTHHNEGEAKRSYPKRPYGKQARQAFDAKRPAGKGDKDKRKEIFSE